MKTKIVIFITIAVILTTLIFVLTVLTPQGWQANLVSPGFNPLGVAQKTEPIPSSSPNIKAPKEFKFDESTDLKTELEKVNPQVLDSDFE